MLKKLLKYDLKAIYKPLCVFYGIILSCALLARIFATINSTSFFVTFCQEFFKGATIGFSIGAIINNAMNTWEYFRHNLYGDRGYLMHTLPVSRNTLLASKILTAMITSLTTITLSIAAILLTQDASSDIFTFLSSNLGTSLQLLLVLYLEIIFIMQCGISGIIIGHKFNYHKIILSIACGFGIFLLCNVITVLILFLWAQSNQDLAWIFNNVSSLSADMEHSVHTALNFATVVYIIYSAGLCTLNASLLSRGIDLD